MVKPEKDDDKRERCDVDDSYGSRSLVCKKRKLRNSLATSGGGDLQLQMVGCGLQLPAAEDVLLIRSFCCLGLCLISMLYF